MIFLTGTTSGFILESFGYMSQNISEIYTYTVQAIIQLLPQFDKYNPTKFLVPARLMSWGFLSAKWRWSWCASRRCCCWLLALLIFSFRELAKVVV